MVDAVPLVMQIGQAAGEIGAEDRAADLAARLKVVEASIGQRVGGAEALARLVGDDPQRAGAGIAAIERALRPAQDFDALDIVEVEHRADLARLVDVVDIDRDHRLLNGVGLAHAAQGIGLGGVADIGPGDGEVGDLAGEVADRVDLAVLQVLGPEGRNRDRRILQVGFAPLGGHHHLVHTGRVRRRLRLGYVGDSERGCRRQQRDAERNGDPGAGLRNTHR